MHEMLFGNQKKWIGNNSKVYDYAQQLGLNVDEFKACIESGKYREEVEKDLQDGISYGVTGTPTFFINGKKVVGYRSYDQFAALIEEELQKVNS